MEHWIDELYSALRESNNNYIIYMGHASDWYGFKYVADSYYHSFCFINNCRIDFYDIGLKEYYPVRHNNKKPDLIISEYRFHKIPKPVKKAMARKHKVMYL